MSTDPRKLLIKDFTYDLPDERIAKHPLPRRDSSKLLVFENHQIKEDTYRNLAAYLPADTMLVFNNTRVVEARLLFTKASGGVIEIFCLEPGSNYADITSAMLQQQHVFWNCLVGGASKWKYGMVLDKTVAGSNGDFELMATIADRVDDYFVIKLEWTAPAMTFAEVLHHAGQIPLPPYLHRQPEESDKERYQTIYAKTDGSVAAPTAGLHFTPHVFEQLAAKQIATRFVTLHVGAGTFKPVKTADVARHDMHAEYIDVSAAAISEFANITDKIFAVGTTSLRTLESLYWLGVLIHNSPGLLPGDLVVQQWDPYDLKTKLTAKDALLSLVEWMEKNDQQRLITKTSIMIAPGYKLRVARGIITNFHQPQSTLLLLIAAVVGKAWHEVYDYALNHDFRFLSYGDGCLLFAH